MNLAQLRTFQLAAEHGSFSKAASEQFLSQPAVSLQIRQLERELGVALFTRTGRRVHLTAAGELCLEYVTRLTSLSEEMKRSLQNIESQGITLTVGCAPTTAQSYFPALLTEVKAQAPDIHIRVASLSPDQAVAGVLNAELDFAFLTDGYLSDRLTAEYCFPSRLFIVAPPTHPLARRKRVPAEEVVTHDFVTLPPPWTNPQRLRAWARNFDLDVRVINELPTYDALKSAVRMGLGLSLISENAASAELQNGTLAIVDTPGMPIEMPIYLACRRDTELLPAAKAFRDIAMKGRWRRNVATAMPGQVGA